MAGQGLPQCFWATELFQGQAVLGGCFLEVQCLLSVGGASQVTGRQRSASPGWSGLAGPLHDGGRLPVAGQGLPWCFWASEIFKGVGGAGWLLCWSTASPEGRWG